MATFSRTWNAAYEAQPADTEDVSLGATRIRNLKEDINERLSIDHSWDGDGDDGEHTKITFTAPLASDPATVTNKGFLYPKDVSTKIELHWRDEDGNIVQITNAGNLNLFPTGTRMLFQQTTAPTGWTKDTTANLNNTALRIVTGTVGSETAQQGFDVVFAKTATDGHTLTIAEMPSHDHVIRTRIITGGVSTGHVSRECTSGSSTSSGPIESTGGGGSHSHDMDIRLNYHDVIVATKD